METPLVSITLLAAETSGDSHYENQQSFNHNYKSICDALQAAFLQDFPAVFFPEHNRFKMANAVSQLCQDPPECHWAFITEMDGKTSNVEYLILNGDSHNHVIFGRAALWLHGHHLNGVATFFCSSCSIQIHQEHALFS